MEKKLISLLFIFCIAVALAGCAQGNNSSTENSTSYVGDGDLKSYKIGTFGPRSGSTAVYGTAVTNAVELAVKDYNEKNGTNIETIIADSQGDQTQAINIYTKFTTEDKVVGIIGGTLSGESTAVSQITSDTGIPMISPSATVADFTNLAGRNVFRACFTDPQQARLAADKAIELGYSKVAIIYNADDEYSTGLTDAFSQQFKDKGGEVLACESFGTADQDFSAQLTKIAGLDIDLLFVPNYYEKDVQIASQARKLGITAQLLGCDGWDGVLEVAGSDTSAIEGAIFINQYSPDMETVQDIMTRYEATYNMPINSFGINAYDSALLLLESIAKTGSLEADKIVETIAKTDYVGILGSLAFDDNGDPIKTPIFVTIKNGAYVTFNQ